MTTKDCSLYSSNAKYQSSGTKNAVSNLTNQYSNLNLNENQKCSNYKPFQSTFCTEFIPKGETAVFLAQASDQWDNYEQENKNAWMNNKSQKGFSFAAKKFQYSNISSDFSESNESKSGEKSLKSNSSTLSLHIAAYENSAEFNNDSENAQKDKNVEKVSKTWKNVKISFSSSPSMTSCFEFPRQQENSHSSTPGIMQFKASQKLLNPNVSGFVHSNAMKTSLINFNRIISTPVVRNPVKFAVFIPQLLSNAHLNRPFHSCATFNKSKSADEIYVKKAVKYYSNTGGPSSLTSTDSNIPTTTKPTPEELGLPKENAFPVFAKPRGNGKKQYGLVPWKNGEMLADYVLFEESMKLAETKWLDYDGMTRDEKDIYIAHLKAVKDRKLNYIDPKTKLRVMTVSQLLHQEKCCGNGCRHCPYGMENASEDIKKNRKWNGAFYV